MADEPIASLDPKSARRVMDILAELNREDEITVLVSLHQVEYALIYCPRTIALRDGRVVYDGPSSNLTPAFLADLYGAESEELFLPGLQGGGTEVPIPRAPQRAEPESAEFDWHSTAVASRSAPNGSVRNHAHHVLPG
jgi:phosphonate transport system ATP-binding protein